MKTDTQALPERRKLTAQTLAYYPPDSEGMHIAAFPEMNGWKCQKWSASDVFEERDTAYRLLAKIAIGDIGYGDAEDLASEFFDSVGESPHNYYEGEEEEE